MRLSGSPINYRLGSLYSVVTAILYAFGAVFVSSGQHLNSVQFVFLTQFALLVSIPMLTAPPPSRRDFVALLRKTANYGYLAVIFAIGMSGLLLYNFGLSNAHPIIISAVLNLSPFWAALVALLIAGVPIPISKGTFFGCLAPSPARWRSPGVQLDDAGMSTIRQLAAIRPRQLDLRHSSSALFRPGWNARRQMVRRLRQMAAIAANFLTANII